MPSKKTAKKKVIDATPDPRGDVLGERVRIKALLLMVADELQATNGALGPEGLRNLSRSL